jgi:hypothetical protein
LKLGSAGRGRPAALFAANDVTAGDLELARTSLPSINVALGIFKSTLDGIRNVLPGGDGKSAGLIGGHASRALQRRGLMTARLLDLIEMRRAEYAAERASCQH